MRCWRCRRKNGRSLAEKLLESLDSPDQREIDVAWAEEVKRRIAAVESGQMGTIPADEVFRRLREGEK